MTYHALFERDEVGWWVASVKEVPGCHTQARTIEALRKRLREALALFVSDAKRAEIAESIAMDPFARHAFRQWSKLRRREAEIHAAQQESLRRAVMALVDLGMSYRDVGSILDMSHQRIHQLVAERLASEQGGRTPRSRRLRSDKQ
ncbi:MAG: type II toxin-antitoxin system HicB family antitoxin [Pseudomonadota bacterium]